MKPIVATFDVATGETFEREMTKAEYEQFLKDQEIAQANIESLLAKQAVRESAIQKLAALGLTDEEIQALVG